MIDGTASDETSEKFAGVARDDDDDGAWCAFRLIFRWWMLGRSTSLVARRWEVRFALHKHLGSQCNGDDTNEPTSPAALGKTHHVISCILQQKGRISCANLFQIVVQSSVVYHDLAG